VEQTFERTVFQVSLFSVVHVSMNYTSTDALWSE